ncbi:hypothetical protein GCM10008955_29470 [Deinococcus malanensis]|uniref:Urease accessory protein UreH-like transmembrane domain-containing protein n=2 Tax=Deinococcus malanensis TaxID=1706855 RepID=A0ABQ2EZS0_9DEIO|nr:hypothetical protein GCM10008955_29470 [Deinococcus malanensis]
MAASAAILTALVFAWPSLAPALKGVALDLYRWSGSLNAAVSGPVNALRGQTGTSLLTPFLLGLLAITAPCQLSTGAATLAYVARDGTAAGAWPRSVAFVLARLLVYLLLGAVAVAAFGGTMQAPGTFFTGVRRVLGPLMLLVGLVMVGVLRPRFSVGSRFAGWLESHARARHGTAGAFALGLAFSFAFCPTLFLLYFGLTLPMALTAPLGLLYPVAFVLGMMLPLLVVVAFLSTRGAGQPRGLLGGLRRFHRLATPLAGSVLVLAGVYDTFLYWLL